MSREGVLSMSLAVKRQQAYDYHETESVHASGQKNKKRKVSPAPRVYGVLIVLGILFVSLLFRYAAISELKYRIYANNQELKEMQIQIEKKKIELEAMTKTSIIEAKAVGDFGMRTPERQQIVYLTPRENTVSPIAVDLKPPSKTTEGKGLFGSMAASIMNLGFLGD